MKLEGKNTEYILDKSLFKIALRSSFFRHVLLLLEKFLGVEQARLEKKVRQKIVRVFSFDTYDTELAV